MESNQIGERPIVAFVISLIAGIVVLSGSVMKAFAGSPYYMGYYGPMMRGYYGGMMGGYYGMMGGFGLAGTWFYVLAGDWSSLRHHDTCWSDNGLQPTDPSLELGSASIGVLDRQLLGDRRFLLGAILGIVGGVLAMTSRPPQTHLPGLQRP